MNKIEKLLASSLFRWDSLRRLNESRVVKLTILVPVIGYLILFNSHLIEYFKLVIDMNLNCCQETGSIWERTRSLRIYYLYFGLTCVGFASIIFQARCPALIKAHPSSLQFIEREINLVTARKIYEFSEEVQRLANTPLRRGERELFERGNDRMREVVLDPRAAFASISLDVLRIAAFPDLMHLLYRLTRLSRPVSRLGATALYGAGFAILAVPTIETFIVVARIFWIEVGKIT
jgi:hypothetical protein